ncbi:hypothetical protein LEP1GSC192_3492 [Leptospira sp. B5-022]|nr:hypothetical protein LEP1GSC192_3492 [Leptospira sp. B5-022]
MLKIRLYNSEDLLSCRKYNPKIFRDGPPRLEDLLSYNPPQNIVFQKCPLAGFKNLDHWPAS